MTSEIISAKRVNETSYRGLIDSAETFLQTRPDSSVGPLMMPVIADGDDPKIRFIFDKARFDAYQHGEFELEMSDRSSVVLYLSRPESMQRFPVPRPKPTDVQDRYWRTFSDTPVQIQVTFPEQEQSEETFMSALGYPTGVRSYADYATRDRSSPYCLNIPDVKVSVATENSGDEQSTKTFSAILQVLSEEDRDWKEGQIAPGSSDVRECDFEMSFVRAGAVDGKRTFVQFFLDEATDDDMFEL